MQRAKEGRDFFMKDDEDAAARTMTRPSNTSTTMATEVRHPMTMCEPAVDKTPHPPRWGGSLGQPWLAGGLTHTHRHHMPVYQ